jgi:hypothetical protein
MSAIASYRTQILALLFDPILTIFSNDNCDDGLRVALLEYSTRYPLIRTYQFDVIAPESIHNLPADFITRQIVDVELYNADPGLITHVPYYAFYRDEGWIIQTLQGDIAAGEVLQISYSDIHQIDGLDAAAGTTVPDADETLLVLGAAGHAAQARAIGTVEIINMNKDVVRDYRLLASDYLTKFLQFISKAPGIQIASLYYPEDLRF